jgi:hypothetical protein
MAQAMGKKMRWKGDAVATERKEQHYNIFTILYEYEYEYIYVVKTSGLSGSAKRVLIAIFGARSKKYLCNFRSADEANISHEESEWNYRTKLYCSLWTMEHILIF